MKSYKAQQRSQAGRSPGLLMVVPVLLAAFLMFGCGSDPVSTFNDADAAAVSQAPGIWTVDKHQKCWEASGWVTVADGGTVDLGLRNRGASLAVAPGSINEDALVEMTVCINKHPFAGEFEFVQFEFLPEDVEFNPAATLTVKANALKRLKGRRGAPKVIKLYYFNENSGEWEVAAKARVKRGKVTFKLDHFSKYGISS